MNSSSAVASPSRASGASTPSASGELAQPFGESSMMEGVEPHQQGQKKAGEEPQQEEEEEEEEEEEAEDQLLQDQEGEDQQQQEEEEEEIEEEESYYESGSSHSEGETWISSFCSMKGHEYFAEVTEDFIEDDFNLTGLSSLVPYYKEALDMILDFETDPDDAAHLPNIPIIENSADQLYGLIHARFLLTRQGLAVMAEKYDLAHFGSCPRYLCHSTPLLPIGTSDLPSRDTVKLYCPNCTDIYSPAGKEESEVDGAYFGTSFAGLFLKTYTDIPGPLGGLRIPASTAVSPQTSKQQKQSQSQQSSHPQPGNGTDPTTTTTTPATTSSQQQPTSTSPTASASSTTSSASTTDRTTATPSSSEDAAVNTLLCDSDSKWEVFQMHLFGFKVSERARSGPRMRWLRERPRVLSDINPF